MLDLIAKANQAVEEYNANKARFSDNGSLTIGASPIPGFGDEKTVLEEKMRFSYDYTCHQSGTTSRTFEFKAMYNTVNHQIELERTTNIDYWADPDVHFINDNSPRDFVAGFHHSVCVAYEQVICSYTFTGRIEGSVYSSFISLDIIEASTNADENPKITEACIDFGTHQPVCPSVHGGQCVFHRVRWSYPHASSAGQNADA